MVHAYMNFSVNCVEGWQSVHNFRDFVVNFKHIMEGNTFNLAQRD